MTTTNGNRAILDLARWEFCTPAPVAKAAGSLVISSRHFRQQQLFVQAATVHYMYHPAEDAWVQIQSGALGTAIAAGACGTSPAIGPSGTATAGTTSTITTNLSLARDLRGYKIHITGGPNAGATLEILRNTVGTNSVITVATQASAFTTATTYRLLTPCWLVLAPGTLVASSFRRYCWALDTWVSLSITGIPASWGTDGKMVGTPSYIDDDYVSFENFTATGNTNTTNATITCSGKTWTTNQWSNHQVRVVSGTGAGQIKTITSNTGTVLTLSGVWTTPLSTDSVINIEGNDDFVYLLGNNAVTMYRYSISGNSWTTLSPTAARAAAPGAGMSANWIWDVGDSDWNNVSDIKNGRYIYSFQGNTTNALHRYDIALNTWETMTYAPRAETFAVGTQYSYNNNHIYISKESTGRWFKYSIPRYSLVPWSTNLYPAGAVTNQFDTTWDVCYKDGSTEINYIYTMLNTTALVMRCPVISPSWTQ